MSKKAVLCLSGIATILLILYLAYEAESYGYHTIATFFDVYINRTQKYLFNGSLYGVPLIYGLSRPFMAPEYRIRIKTNIAYKLIIKSICDAMIMGAWIILLFVLTSVLMKFKIEAGWFLITIYIRLVILYAQCGGVYYLIYAVVDSEIVAACGTMGMNLCALMAILLYDFMAEPLYDISLNLFLLYICISCFCASVSLVSVVRSRRRNI